MGIRQEIENPMISDRGRYYRAPRAFRRCECGQARAIAKTDSGGYRCQTCMNDEGLTSMEVTWL